jgi:hypothetical protein
LSKGFPVHKAQKASALNDGGATGLSQEAIAVASASSRESLGFGNKSQVASPKLRAKALPSAKDSHVAVLRVRRMVVQVWCSI